MSGFGVGDLVVGVRSAENERVRAALGKWPDGCVKLQPGRILTIRDIHRGGQWDGLYFEEIVNPMGPTREWSYAACNFRRVKTISIAIFHKLTSPTPRVEERVKYE